MGDPPRERAEHIRLDCYNKPPSRSGTKAWKAARRHKAAAELLSDRQPVVILEPPGGKAGGTPVKYAPQGEVLGCIVCGDGNCDADVTRRLGIGRRYYNKLFRFYTNEDLPEDLRIEFFAAAVIGGASS